MYFVYFTGILAICFGRLCLMTDHQRTWQQNIIHPSLLKKKKKKKIVDLVGQISEPRLTSSNLPHWTVC